MINQKRIHALYLCIVFVLLFIVPDINANTISVNWDDETLQGWTPESLFGGVLGVDNNGNPGGSMSATDTGGGGMLRARAPNILSGDQSAYIGIQWDEYIAIHEQYSGGTFNINFI